MKNLYTPSDTEVLKHIGSKLKFYRLFKNLSQKDLAEIVGFTRSYYTKIESGKRNPSILNLYKLSQALDISLVKIVDIEKSMKGEILGEDVIHNNVFLIN